MALDALNSRIVRCEKELAPTNNNDRSEARAMLPYISDSELAAMSAVYEAAATRLGVAQIHLLEADVMLASEIALFERIEQNALSRKAAGKLPYSISNRC